MQQVPGPHLGYFHIFYNLFEFLVNFTGARYVDVDPEEDESLAEPHIDNTTTPKKKSKTCPWQDPPITRAPRSPHMPTLHPPL